MNDSFIQITEKFLALEKENNLFDIKIKGHSFWDYVRYYVFEEINRTKTKVVFPKKKISYRKKVSELLQYFLFRLKCRLKKQTKFDLLLLTHNKTTLIDGKKVYFHVYPIAKAFQKTLKILIGHQHEFPITPSDYPCPTIFIRPLFLYCRVKSMFIKFSPEDQALFDKISILINKTFDINISIYALAKYIYAWNLACYDEYLKFFKAYRPSAIIFCDSADTKSLIEAARKVGIKTIDYQHGVISPVSMIYTYPKGSPVEVIKKTNVDTILTFGEYWHQFITSPAEPVSVGFPFLDICTQKVQPTSREEKSILITSVLSSRKELGQLAINLANLLPDFTIYYKMRPDEHDSIQANYPPEFLTKSNIVIIDNNNGSLYDFFAKCTYLVSTNSMTLYEGLANGLKAFVLKAGLYEEMRQLYEQKYVTLISSAEEIVAEIRNHEEKTSKNTENLFFKKNSIQHLESFFNDYLKSNDGLA